MVKTIYDLPVLNFVFRTVKAIPIVSRKVDPETYQSAFDEIDPALAAGELVCIFPEGSLTRDGELNEFKPGIEKILVRRLVPVVPMALRGLWGSFFSGKCGFLRNPRRFWSKVDVEAGTPLARRPSTSRCWRSRFSRFVANAGDVNGALSVPWCCRFERRPLDHSGIHQKRTIP